MMLILCGKSGSGKDTIASEIVKKYSDASRLVSYTTRPMRDGEADGREYHFVSKEFFAKEVEAGNFIEYRSYSTLMNNVPDEWFYGTRKFNRSENGELLVVIKDLDGAKALKDYCKEIGEPCTCVIVEVPDKIRESRAKKRGSFDKTEWDRRLAADRADFSNEKIRGVVDRMILNDGDIEHVSNLADLCYYGAIPTPKLSEELTEENEIDR